METVTQEKAYEPPMAIIHDIIIIDDQANDRYVQAEVIESYTNFEGKWRYRVLIEAHKDTVGDNDIVAVYREGLVI